MLATVFVSFRVKLDIEQKAVREFAFACDRVALKIQERLNDYDLVLHGASGLFAGSILVERKEWRAYFESLLGSKHIPGVQGFGFAEVIPANQLASHIARIRGEGFPEYTVKPQGERPSIRV